MLVKLLGQGGWDESVPTKRIERRRFSKAKPAFPAGKKGKRLIRGLLPAYEAEAGNKKLLGEVMDLSET